MAAPVANYVKLPQDGAYTGKQVRVLQRVVGADTTYTHQYAYISPNKINTVYYFDSGVPSAIVATAHDAVSTGFLWIQNPSASVNLRVRRLEMTVTNATNTIIVHDTAPRIAVARGTFTGSFAGATLTACKRRTADGTPACDVRTASTGATITLGTIMWAGLVPGNDITGGVDVGNYRHRVRWDMGDDDNTAEDEMPVIAQNECLIVYQADNGTTSDQRVVHFAGMLDEIDIT